MSDLYSKVEKFVVDSFTKKGKLITRGSHSLKVAKWLLKICPEADEAMQIAAVAHDIDSAFIDYEFQSGFKDPEYLNEHQRKSAEIIGEFLEKENADKDLIKRVMKLVEKHEVGGDDEQNLIKDADSLGFFDRNLVEFIQRHKLQGRKREELEEKIDWMYERITSERAKELARPLYQSAIKDLTND